MVVAPKSISWLRGTPYPFRSIKQAGNWHCSGLGLKSRLIMTLSSVSTVWQLGKWGWRAINEANYAPPFLTLVLTLLHPVVIHSKRGSWKPAYILNDASSRWARWPVGIFRRHAAPTRRKPGQRASVPTLAISPIPSHILVNNVSNINQSVHSANEWAPRV